MALGDDRLMMASYLVAADDGKQIPEGSRFSPN
jgi:hypothetical protein